MLPLQTFHVVSSKGAGTARLLSSLAPGWGEVQCARRVGLLAAAPRFGPPAMEAALAHLAQSAKRSARGSETILMSGQSFVPDLPSLDFQPYPLRRWRREHLDQRAARQPEPLLLCLVLLPAAAARCRFRRRRLAQARIEKQ